MRAVGFTIVRNAIHYDYPVVESIRSVLPLVDEMVVAVGKSIDGTLALIKSIDSPKLRIIETVWDENLRKGGTILSQQTNFAMKHCEGDWGVYLQADEVLHENDLDRIDQSMKQNLDRKAIDGLRFRYHHFRFDYDIRDPLPYRKQIRVVRLNSGVQSFGDACGFRRDGAKLRSASTGAWVYHYGYVKPPEKILAKADYFASLYDGRDVEPGKEDLEQSIDLELATCERFTGEHPTVMHDRIATRNWELPTQNLVPSWRNPNYYVGLFKKNTRTFDKFIARFTSSATQRSAA